MGLPCLVVGEDGVHAFDVFQGAQDGVGHVAKTVFVPPLQVANPHSNLRQFVGVRVDLDAVQLLRAHRQRNGRQFLAGGVGNHLLLQVEQLAQGHVKEVAGAASGVQHAHGGNLGGKIAQQFVSVGGAGQSSRRARAQQQLVGLLAHRRSIFGARAPSTPAPQSA